LAALHDLDDGHDSPPIIPSSYQAKDGCQGSRW
jgi:hypothetical protein